MSIDIHPDALALDTHAQDLLFRDARTANSFTDEPVTDEQLAAIHDLVKWGPTAMNQNPLRIVAVPFYGWALLHDGGDSVAWRWVACAIFVVAMITDKVDGDIARARNLVTDFGKIADPIAVYQMTNILTGGVQRGTGTAAGNAGKTVIHKNELGAGAGHESANAQLRKSAIVDRLFWPHPLKVEPSTGCAMSDP